jgi:6,7-dimethyl-8-ribityllumazine synthase
MSERYDDVRRPFDLDAADESRDLRVDEPERAPWDKDGAVVSTPPPERPLWVGDDRVPYAAEDVVDDTALEEQVEEEDDVEPEPEEEFVQPTEPKRPVPVVEHAAGGLDIPDGYRTLEGQPKGRRRAVAVVVGRFNGDITNQLLARALAALDEANVSRDAVTIMPVPGAFELPLAAMALAKTRRYACVIALACVIRGETPHFDFVAQEAASGLQLAALETGTPVAFGVLTVETHAQAEARLGRAADAVRSALEMADVFSQLRAATAR